MPNEERFQFPRSTEGRELTSQEMRVIEITKEAPAIYTVLNTEVEAQL